MLEALKSQTRMTILNSIANLPTRLTESYYLQNVMLAPTKSYIKKDIKVNNLTNGDLQLEYKYE